MRKISRESAKAFVNFEPYKKDNTEVVIDHNGEDAKLYLHDHCIAYSIGFGVVKNIDLCGWHTATTRERINGVLEAWGYDFFIAQKNDEQILIRGRYPKRKSDNEQQVLKLSDDSFDPDFAKRVFNSDEFISGTDLGAIKNF